MKAFPQETCDKLSFWIFDQPMSALPILYSFSSIISKETKDMKHFSIALFQLIHALNHLFHFNSSLQTFIQHMAAVHTNYHFSSNKRTFVVFTILDLLVYLSKYREITVWSQMGYFIFMVRNKWNFQLLTMLIIQFLLMIMEKSLCPVVPIFHVLIELSGAYIFNLVLT